jgi:hypothetical protein
MKWYEENNQLILKDQFGKGCAGIMALIIGGFFALGGFLFFGFMIEEMFGNIFEIGIKRLIPLIREGDKDISILAAPLIFGFIGLVAFLSGVSMLTSPFKKRVIIDSNKQLIRLDINDGKDGYEFHFGEVDSILIRKETRRRSSSSRSSTTYTVFVINIVKVDGALFWVDSFTTNDKLIQHIEILKGLTGFKVTDPDGLYKDVGAGKTYEYITSTVPNSKSKLIQIKNELNGKKITIRTSISIISIITLFIVFVLFSSIPALIFGSLVTSSLFTLVFIIPFGFLFYSIFIIIMLTMFKRYIIKIRGSEIQIQLKFAIPFVDSFLGKKIQFNRDNVKSIRLNYYETTGFKLSMGLYPPVELGGMSSLFFNSGIFNPQSRTSSSGLRENEQEIGLWEIPVTQRSKNGPKIQDLFYLEKYLENEISVDESIKE